MVARKPSHVSENTLYVIMKITMSPLICTDS